MGAETGISWCDSTWNPITGCAKISPGCDHCYAAKLSERNLPAVGKWGPDAERVYSAAAWTLLPTWNRQAEKGGKIRTVFCASLADMFEGTQQTWPAACDWCGSTGFVTRNECMDLCEACGGKRLHKELRDGPRAGHLAVLLRLAEESPRYPWLRFLMLSKRPWNQVFFAQRHGWPATWWQGITVESQKHLEPRCTYPVPGAKRFLSVEPMVGPLRFSDPDVPWLNLCAPDPDRPDDTEQMIHWLIAGGESGPNARPPHPDWFRSLRDQCAAAGVPFHFKQWGEFGPVADAIAYQHWLPESPTDATDQACVLVRPDGTSWKPPTGGVQAALDAWEALDIGNDDHIMQRVGKTAAGHLLDGRAHLAFPDFTLSEVPRG